MSGSVATLAAIGRASSWFRLPRGSSGRNESNCLVVLICVVAVLQLPKTPMIAWLLLSLGVF